MSDVEVTEGVTDAPAVSVADTTAAAEVPATDTPTETVAEDTAQEAPAAVEEPAVEQAADEEPAVEEPVAEAPAVEEAPEEVEEAPEEKAAVEEPAVEAAGDAPAEKAEKPAIESEFLGANVTSEDELLEEADAEPAPRPESPFDRPGRWFVVHTQSGHEKKAQQNLAARTESMNMEDRIFESVIPMEDVVEFRNGKKVVVQKKMFPGYLLVRAHLDDDAWYVVRNTPSVVNFVGSGGKPSPLLRREVETFLQVKEEGAPVTPNKRPSARLEYEMGETVRVKEGPFADFSGEIVEINEDQLKVKVLVNIFGRETPVELEFSQIARL